MTFHYIFLGNKVHCSLNAKICFCILSKCFNVLLLLELITKSYVSEGKGTKFIVILRWLSNYPESLLEKLFKSRIMKYTDDYFTPMEFPKIVRTFVYNYTKVLRVLVNVIYILSQN